MSKKKIVKKIVKKRAPLAKARAARVARAATAKTPKTSKLGDLDIAEESAAGVDFVRKSGPSMYAPVVEKVRGLLPGRMVKVRIPKDFDPVKFRQHISSAVRKRMKDHERPDGLRVRLIRAETGTVTHVAVVRRAAE